MAYIYVIPMEEANMKSSFLLSQQRSAAFAINQWPLFMRLTSPHTANCSLTVSKLYTILIILTHVSYQ